MTEDLMEWECDKVGVLYLNSFWGGKKYQRCIQLTMRDGYVQMMYQQARQFFQEAIKKIDEIEQRCSENPHGGRGCKNELRER